MAGAFRRAPRGTKKPWARGRVAVAADASGQGSNPSRCRSAPVLLPPRWRAVLEDTASRGYFKSLTGALPTAKEARAEAVSRGLAQTAARSPFPVSEAGQGSRRHSLATTAFSESSSFALRSLHPPKEGQRAWTRPSFPLWKRRVAQDAFNLRGDRGTRRPRAAL